MRVSEFYASSRPHPWWKTDSQLVMSNARRRSSTAGEMLDRNVCFVESPGRSKQDLSYVKSHLSALLTKPMDDADLFALLNAGGEPIVDVLLYLIPHKGTFLASLHLGTADIVQVSRMTTSNTSRMLNI
jgi:hypothetical protein